MSKDPKDLMRKLEEIAKELETGTDYTAAATVRDGILWIDKAWDELLKKAK